MYLLTFVDDCSRQVFVFPMKKKSEVFGLFISFKKMVENQQNATIKVLRSDSIFNQSDNMQGHGRYNARENSVQIKAKFIADSGIWMQSYGAHSKGESKESGSKID